MIFGRKRRKEATKAESSKIDPRARCELGVFSPALDATQPEPAKQCRRLAELDAIFIRSKRLDSLNDVPFVVNEVREGNIVLLDISRLNNGTPQTYLELKRIIERIRGETRCYSADIAIVNDSCVMVAPSFVKF